jgi:predicted porin
MMTAHGAADSAWNNALAYNSPVMAGVTVALMAAPSEGGTGGRRLGGSVSYGAPGQPLAAVLSVERIANASLTTPLKNTALAGAVPPLAINDSQTVALGVSYDFKVAKAFAQWDHTELETTRAAAKPTLDLKTLQLGVSVPVSRGRVLFSVAHTDKQMSAAQDESRKTYAIGYDHDLSKNVDLYTVLLRDSVTGLSSGTTLAVGGRLRF